jgi:hypothetical protein
MGTMALPQLFHRNHRAIVIIVLKPLPRGYYRLNEIRVTARITIQG